MPTMGYFKGIGVVTVGCSPNGQGEVYLFGLYFKFKNAPKIVGSTLFKFGDITGELWY